jgi:hypothetical protein
MKILLICSLLFPSALFAQQANILNFGADGAGVKDSGPAINGAIASLKGRNCVVTFPPAAQFYLIATSIVDSNTNCTQLTMDGKGGVQLVAASSVSGAMITFSGVSYRHIQELVFNCNSTGNLDGIHLNGFSHGSFTDVVVNMCPGHAITEINGTSNYMNYWQGGGWSHSGSAQLVGQANAWDISGVAATGGSSWSTVGLEISGSAAISIHGSDFSDFATGVLIGGASDLVAHAVSLEGNYFEENSANHIQVGVAGQQNFKALGVTIEGNYFNCYAVVQTPVAIDVQQSTGYVIQGNDFTNPCSTAAVRQSTNGVSSGSVTGNSLNGNKVI